ncbi:hypothetical protein BAUCODRAFT_149440 [Baudoinia panamericana UAMH 10762]|uniref:Uncharacterized protein n=1 Tax=Baudoinia panamericana (strain UAMH 10762) TaxID=717646 RepID=M2MV67_BAUPA|nr:uncharacterized protein BAUCODRAFT_149440 [Baudoinia panamericana UAMH 10762]EMC95473.1 hypothetical protein BAUCODRAFT_149440 [Baudoinia panamericana UAMH 10762]
MKTSAIVFSLLSGAFGAALDSRNYISYCKSYVDTYDDIPASTLLPTLTPVNIYNGLDYGGFLAAQPIVGTAGIVPKSLPNNAVATLSQDILELGSLSLNPFGTIAAASGTKSFNLVSFYFGCLLSSKTGAADLSEGCTVAVTGYYTNGQQAPEVTFAFAPTSPNAAPLNLATLPSTYTGLKNVTFGIANAAVQQQDTDFVVDNLVHCNYS